MQRPIGPPHLVVLPGSGSPEVPANPTRLAGLVELDDVDQHRSLMCDLYDDCLDRALRQGWQSWTCSKCELFALAETYRSLHAVHEGGLRPSA
jgi:hypothetical protein